MGLLTTLNALGGGGDSLPSQTGNNGKFLTTDGSNPSWATISGGGDMLAANNLSDLLNASTARTNLGLGALATLSAVGDAQVSSGIDAAKIGGGAVSNTEFSYLDGVTSAIQTQIDAKVSSNSAITGNTKTKITYDAKGLVTAGTDATTADVADSTNKRYVTDAQLTVIGNTSGTNTGDQNMFSTIAVSGQSDVVADSTSDTLTLVAGSNITITTNATTDSITISATGGGGSGDVTAAANIADNRLVRGDGGAKGIQQSGITISDSNDVSGINDIVASGNLTAATGGVICSYVETGAVLLNNNAYIVSGGDAGNVATICAYDTDGFAEVPFITLTSNNTPTCNLSNSVTIGGDTIVSRTGSQTLTNKTLTSPVISSISNTGTSTVPTSTGTLTNRTAGVFDTAISSTITWDGTAPSGTSNLRYSWQQFGGWVFAQFRLEYATAGTTNTQVSIDLPSDMPLPLDFTGAGDTEVMLAGSGNAYTSMTSSGSQAKVMMYKDSGASSGYLLWCRGFSSSAAKGAVMFIAYPCVSGSRL